MIISVDLKPGQAISENSVCELTGVSRTPIRSAITRLAEEEFIDVFPQQGTYVSLINLQKVREGHFVRLNLEKAILREAAKNWSSNWSSKLIVEIELQRIAAKQLDAKKFQHHDDAFHLLFAECAGVAGAWKLVRHAKDHLDRMRYLAAPEKGHMNKVIKEHEAILNALNQKDISKTTDKLISHLNTITHTIDELVSRYEHYFIDE